MGRRRRQPAVAQDGTTSLAVDFAWARSARLPARSVRFWSIFSATLGQPPAPALTLSAAADGLGVQPQIPGSEVRFQAEGFPAR